MRKPLSDGQFFVLGLLIMFVIFGLLCLAYYWLLGRDMLICMLQGAAVVVGFSFAFFAVRRW